LELEICCITRDELNRYIDHMIGSRKLK